MPKTSWSTKVIDLAIELHAELSLNNKNWHQLKSNHERRAAELIASALIQLIRGGKSSDVEVLLEQSILWLKREIKDPGCPNH